MTTCLMPEYGLTGLRMALKTLDLVTNKSDESKMVTNKLFNWLSKESKRRSMRMHSRAKILSCSASMQDMALHLEIILTPC